MMGSGFLTFDQAATRLKTSKRSIHNYVKRGWIRKEVLEGKVGVSAVDVDQLVEDRKVNALPLNRQTFLDLHMKVQRLQERMAVHDSRAGIDGNPLRPNEANARALHSSAKAALSDGSWSDAEVIAWIDLLNRLDEVDLKMIASSCGELQPWTPFFNLCLEMEQMAERRFFERTTLEGEKLLVSVRACKRHLRSLAVVWVEMGHSSASDIVIKASSTDREAVLASISAKAAKRA
jgi:hypothetical protein